MTDPSISPPPEVGRYGSHRTAAGELAGRKYESPDGACFAIASIGGNGPGGAEAGWIWLFRPNAKPFSPGSIVRPRHVAVANNGAMIVGDSLAISDQLRCRVRIWGATGHQVHSGNYSRNCGGVGISASGRTAIFSTAAPGPVLRVFDLASETLVANLPGVDFFDVAEIDELSRALSLDGGRTILSY